VVVVFTVPAILYAVRVPQAGVLTNTDTYTTYCVRIGNI